MQLRRVVGDGDESLSLEPFVFPCDLLDTTGLSTLITEATFRSLGTTREGRTGDLAVNVCIEGGATPTGIEAAIHKVFISYLSEGFKPATHKLSGSPRRSLNRAVAVGPLRIPTLIWLEDGETGDPVFGDKMSRVHGNLPHGSFPIFTEPACYIP